MRRWRRRQARRMRRLSARLGERLIILAIEIREGG